MARLATDDGARKVLVVDDDADWREFLRLSLEDLGYETTEASDGQEALDTLRRGERYRVMLLDLNMPGMSGLEVVERLPRGQNHPRIVFLTSAAAQDVGSALLSGPHYYLPKGASRDQLSLLLQSLGE
ncbi:response regulator [Pyxidicoccus xibeiensis]|uniref:response regulator n=1 Tax=Pyxidicoccus xibeiensis TaxID=2906759 RepID=UPI0020A81650|nr:response regulator [Pyxidicoccus xibeiensis]MCP3144827.1 response regulator [Pyxidicoccus xibeiensis]